MVVGFELPSDEPRTIVWVCFVACVDINPPNTDGGLASDLAGDAEVPLSPNAFLVEEIELQSSCLLHQLIFEDLPGQVVVVYSGLALSRAIARSRDLLLVVLGLQPEAAVLGDAVGSQLVGCALDDGTA